MPWIPSRSIALGPIVIHWYGILLTTGIVLGYLIALKRSKEYGIAVHHIENLMLLLVPIGIIGARLYHVVLTWEYYRNNLFQIINIPAGGLAIHGAIIACAFTVIIYTRIHRLNPLTLLDLGAPQILIGQFIGRWGNFFNQELYGKPTDLPWKIYISPENRLPQYYHYQYFHPTFLYESLLDLTFYLILFFLSKRVRDKPSGIVFGGYLISYGLIRIITESIRIDSEYLFGIKFPIIVSSLFIVIGAGLIIYLLKHKPATSNK
jgi:phosphatidylglycerol:prolipoprotein diacylglycerol transferase